MSLLTEKSRLILRVLAHDLRKWWRSRRWVRRRIIRKNCRRFITLDGAHDEALGLFTVPGSIVHHNQPRAFDILEVPSARSMLVAREQERHRFELEVRRRVEEDRLKRQRYTAGPETEFESRYLEAMKRPPS